MSFFNQKQQEEVDEQHQQQQTIEEEVYGSDVQVDYDQEYSPHTISSLFQNQSLNQLQFQQPSMGQSQYLFQDGETQKTHHDGLSYKLCFRTGIVYALGLSMGGIWGFYEGMKAPLPLPLNPISGSANKMSSGQLWKLRMNSVLNGMTRRGPLLGNSFGILNLFYTPLDHYMSEYVESPYLHHTLSAAVSGAIFRSTRGVLEASKAGVLFGALGLMGTSVYQWLENNL